MQSLLSWQICFLTLCTLARLKHKIAQQCRKTAATASGHKSCQQHLCTYCTIWAKQSLMHSICHIQVAMATFLQFTYTKKILCRAQQLQCRDYGDRAERLWHFGDQCWQSFQCFGIPGNHGLCLQHCHPARNPGKHNTAHLALQMLKSDLCLKPLECTLWWCLYFGATLWFAGCHMLMYSTNIHPCNAWHERGHILLHALLICFSACW